jgi:hypothetical protein
MKEADRVVDRLERLYGQLFPTNPAPEEVHVMISKMEGWLARKLGETRDPMERAVLASKAYDNIRSYLASISRSSRSTPPMNLILPEWP